MLLQYFKNIRIKKWDIFYWIVGGVLNKAEFEKLDFNFQVTFHYHFANAICQVYTFIIVCYISIKWYAFFHPCVRFDLNIVKNKNYVLLV